MDNKNFNPPEFLKIKGYKYRAKMLIAGAVILFIIIWIISMICHGISSAVKSVKKTNSEGTDTETAAVVSMISSDVLSQNSTDISSNNAKDVSQAENTSSVSTDSAGDKNENLKKKEKFDADGALVIDTDNFDGKKAVALTFDDGPGQYTEELISELNKRNAKATFFMVGTCVEKYPDVLPMMIDGGHQLGNHTYNHTDLKTLSSSDMMNAIEKTDNAIYNACGQYSTAFRPPYGSYSTDMPEKINKTFTLWSLDTVDWKNKDSQKVKNTIVSQAKDGDIILLHDIHKTSVEGALLAIDVLQNEGYVFVTVDELLTRYGYSIFPGAHSAQYAVYETNSPHAGDYAEDKARIEREAEAAASSAAGVFYYDKSESSSTGSQAQNNGDDEDDYEYYDEEDIKIIDTHSDTDTDKLIY